MDIGKNNKIQKTYLNGIFSLEKKSYIPALHKKTKDSVHLNLILNDDAKTLYNELQKTKEEQGLIGNLWDGFKNLTKIGAGSNKVEKAIKELNSGKLTKDEAQQILENYKDGQKTSVDVVADMLSSIIAVGAFIAAVPSGGTSLPVGLAISTGISAGLKVGIKGIDAKTNGREYNSKNLLYDVVTGSVNGLLAPVTNGLGSSLTKTIGCKLGLEITGDVLEAGAKNTLKNLIVNQSIDVAGGTIKQRALALGAGMAVDGALGGAADNAAREIIEDKEDKNIFKATAEGFLGGLIMSPIIGGGFRIAGKIGNKIGEKIKFNMKKETDLPSNPFQQKTNAKPKVEQPNPVKTEADIDLDTPQVRPAGNSQNDSKLEISSFEIADSPNKTVLQVEEVQSVEAKQVLHSEPQQKQIKIRELPKSEVFYNPFQKKLVDSLENIPVDVKEKRNFLQAFLMTNPQNGENMETVAGKHRKEWVEEAIDSLLPISPDDTAILLKGWLEASIVQNRTDIYCSNSTNLSEILKSHRKCEQRNVFSLFKGLDKKTEGQMISQIDDFFTFGRMSDNDFNKVLKLVNHLEETGRDFYLPSISDFVTKTNKNTIEYMIDNDLFNPENYCSNEKIHDIFSRMKGLELQDLKKIHERGLLKPVTEEKRFVPILDAVIYVNDLSDSEWQKVIDRNLFALKTNTNRELNDYTIIQLAKVDDEIFNRLYTRNLLDKVGNNQANLPELISLSDEQWKVILDRKIKLDELYLVGNDKLPKILSIPQDKWQIAEKRNFDFVNDDDFALLELSDVEWDNISKRNLDEKKGYSKLYDLESQIKLSKLSDEEFELAQKRNLIKNASRRYDEPAYSDESEFLLKRTDEEFELYTRRNIRDIKTSLDKKKDLFSMTEEQFSRVQNDIIPKTQKYISRYADDKLSEFYKLAYLEPDEYNQAIKFVGLDSVYNEQFTYDEVLHVLSLGKEKKDLLLKLVSPDNENKINYKKAALLKLIEYSDEQYQVVDFAVKLLSDYQLNEYIINDQILEKSFLKNLEQNSVLISKINNSELSREAKKELLDRLLGVKTEDYTKLTLREKIKKISRLQEAQNSSLLEKEESAFLNIDEEIMALQDSIKHVIQSTDVSKTQIKNMFTTFFSNDNLTTFNLLTDTNFAKFAKEGLPLEYPRKAFLNDLSSVLKTLDEKEQSSILNKLGISILESNGEISGYNGIINLNKLSEDGTEGKVLSLARKFIKENKFKTDDDELNVVLNSLIEGIPEFINIIGKKQHGTHDYSLDVHSLMVLKHILDNPEYQKLNNEDKFVLKFVAVLHDIAKAEAINDKEHEQLCALYAKDIMTKNNMNLPADFVTRVFNLVQNHNWLEQYNKDNDIAEQLAVKFRRNNDHKVSQIFAEADLKSVKGDGSFYSKFSHMLEPNIQQQIAMNLDEINKKGHIFLTNKIINKSKIPTVTKNGKTYKVIDFSKMKQGADLSQYGFEPGTTYDNFRLFIHTVNEERLSNILNVINLSDPNYEGFLCASYISLSDNRTFGDNRFGVSIESSNIDVANASVSNQASGRGKNFERFSDVLTGKDKTSKHRDLIPTYIQDALKLTEEEYSQLFSQIQRIKYTSQLDNIPNIKIGDKSFSGTEIKEVILRANDQLIHDLTSHHNEANLYIPKSNAIIAKVNSFDEIPDELLNIAEASDLPIFMLGEPDLDN